MSNSAISIRYARALLRLAEESKQVDQFGGELSTMAELLEREDLLRLLLDSPTFSLQKKTAILHDVAEVLKLSETMRSFFGLLLDKGRISYVKQIDINYRHFADELSGVIRANIRSANKLTKERIDIIRKGLEQQTGKTVVLNVEKDAALIGGLQAEMGGKLFDGSVRTQLKRMADTLAKG
ncbi:MAG: ATP synthase F1 subunit delta [Candidatus Moranbacteria bacterium]|nr:ATP synthase F1 subunit delta [Candidatus Moranbacteria bacterium]